MPTAEGGPEGRISTLTYEVSSHSTGENTEQLMVIETTQNRGRIDEPRILWLLTGFITVGFAEALAFLWTIKFRNLTHLGLAEPKHSVFPNWEVRVLPHGNQGWGNGWQSLVLRLCT